MAREVLHSPQKEWFPTTASSLLTSSRVRTLFLQIKETADLKIIQLYSRAGVNEDEKIEKVG